MRKTEPTASATEQINLKGNPVTLLLTSMVMEITENYFKMRTRPLGHCAAILPSASPQFPNHVSSKNMSEWVSVCGCECVCVCVWTDNSQRMILELISLRWRSDVLSRCGQKKTSHHLWCENCSRADGVVKLSWFSLVFLQAKVPPHADLIENITTNRSNFLQFRFYVVTFHFLLFVTTIITPAWNNQLFKDTLAEQDTTRFLYIHPSIILCLSNSGSHGGDSAVVGQTRSLCYTLHVYLVQLNHRKCDYQRRTERRTHLFSSKKHIVTVVL